MRFEALSRARWSAVLVAGCLLMVSLVASSATSAPPPSPGGSIGAVSLSAVLSAPLAPVADHEPGVGLAGAVSHGPTQVRSLSVLVSFGFSNQTRLSTLLAELSNASSPVYHHYLSATEFDREFAIPASQYSVAIQYFQSFGIRNITTYADHEALTLSAPASQIDRAFHVQLNGYTLGDRSFYAPTGSPSFPLPIARMVGSVEGLSSYSQYLNRVLSQPHLLRTPPAPSSPPAPGPRPGYLAPPTILGTQYEYAPDFQVAYDQLSLFAQAGYPTDSVVATILWSGEYLGSSTITTANGTLSPGQYVGPFVPGDVSAFFNQTLPAGEPHPRAHGVPLLGAPAPGYFASYDSTNAYVENTLDLEMAGSTAPGSQLYNVYGGNSTNADLDTAFAFVLNPNSSYSGLDNVSVISNSWGGTDANDSNWFNDTEEAAARGITVLVASGDSGSDPSSTWGPGVFFPATMAYDSFGDIAVGGTTVTLDPTTFLISNQTAWYVSPNDTQLNGPAGSTGGISTVFAEPSWQRLTSANDSIAGQGRGVPDIAALANNTLMTVSVQGYRYEAVNASRAGMFFQVAGTSVASPLEAGLLSDVDHVLGMRGQPWVGFADPQIYSLANAMVAPYTTTPTTGFFATGTYTSALPTLPFFDVVWGANYLYSAQPGYDLVTGWGSLDAYNYTMYVLSYQPVNVPGQLSAVEAEFNLTGLSVTSTYPGGGVNTYYNASLQQNFFLANSLGAPIYWIQNVVYINRTATGWEMNFTGWVVFPFYGIYYTETVYEYNFPLTGLVLQPPISFNLTTTLVNTSGVDQQAVVFSFGVPGTSTLSLPVPGASYIIGNQSYNYSWQGTTYSNGPYPAPYGGPGGLDPQFGLVGGPSGGIGNFGPSTRGSLRLFLQRAGTGDFLPGITASFNSSVDQTGEAASNITWTEVSPTDRADGVAGVWNVTYHAGAVAQGVYEYDAQTNAAYYLANFSETGISAVQLSQSGWPIQVYGSGGGVAGLCFSEYCDLYLANGTWTWIAGPVPGFHATPSSGHFAISGQSVHVAVTYVAYTYNVTFTEAGLPIGQTWWVNLTGEPSMSTTTTSVTIALTNGSYPFEISGGVWSAHPPSGLATVSGVNVRIPVSFTPPEKFAVTFRETGLPAGSPWSLTIASVGTFDSNGSSLVVSLLNGTYPFSLATGVPGWTGAPANASLTVNGSATSYDVTFVQPTYPVTVSETGLPNGTLWALSVAGGPILSSKNASFVWEAKNGSYNYSVSASVAGFAPVQRSGELTITGAPAVLAVRFVQVNYSVTFEESGLPNGTSWSLTVSTVGVVAGSGPEISVDLPNGSYSYEVAVPSGYVATPASGPISVSGVDQQVAITFHPTSTGTGTNTPLGIPAGSWLLIGVVVAVVVVLAAVLVLRRPGQARRPPTDGTGGAT
jgi:hypothetical protein